MIDEDVLGNPLPAPVGVENYIAKNVANMQLFVDKEWDNIGLICGYEGDGKTELGVLLAFLLRADFSSQSVVFNAEEFSIAVDKARPGDVIIWDEADELTQHWAKTQLQAIKAKMKRIRKLRLHIILITPTHWDMNKYFVINRTRWLIHDHAKGLERGFYRFFNRERKKELYIEGKKTWDWYSAKPNFFGKFGKVPDAFGFDWDDYEQRKDAATQKILVDEGINGKERKSSIISEYRKECVRRFYQYMSYAHPETIDPVNKRKKFYCSQKTIGAIFDCDQGQVSKSIHDDVIMWNKDSLSTDLLNKSSNSNRNVERMHDSGRFLPVTGVNQGEKADGEAIKPFFDEKELDRGSFEKEELISIGKGSVLGGK